jgi:hypothetical protein
MERFVIRTASHKFFAGYWYRGLPVWVDERARAAELNRAETDDMRRRIDARGIFYVVEPVGDESRDVATESVAKSDASSDRITQLELRIKTLECERDSWRKSYLTLKGEHEKLVGKLLELLYPNGPRD